jgi:hypothetical protein
VSPVRYELGSYIPEDGILHSHCRENLKSEPLCSSSAVRGVVSASLLQRSREKAVDRRCWLWERASGCGPEGCVGCGVWDVGYGVATVGAPRGNEHANYVISRAFPSFRFC